MSKNQYHPHQTRGQEPALSAPISQPRCPISNELIDSDSGAHILVAEYNSYTKTWIPVMTLYVHKEVVHPYHLLAKHYRAKLADLLAAFDMRMVS